MKIAIFYHTLFLLGDPPELRPAAFAITCEQMEALEKSGLLAAADTMIVGVNGGPESEDFARLCIPHKARIVYHGLQSHNENLTLVEIEKWVPTHQDYYVLYLHAKGATWAAGSEGAVFRSRWRACMERTVIWNWRKCVQDLNFGFDSVGCHFMVPPATPPGQHIWAGNMWWAKASFLATLPSIYMRARIKQSGIGAIESRYESEVWIGNGPRVPKVHDFHPNWNPSKIAECVA